MKIFTHDRINPAGGILSKSGLLWGQNALQNITIGRHTPVNPVQAVGYLGIVDYTSGVVTSDVQLDTVLVEGCNKASAASGAYKFGQQQMQIGSEKYVLTSAGLNFVAGNPATANFGYLTNGLATYLDIQAAPGPETAGEEARYAVVMGDDGSGLVLVPTWKTGTTPNAAGTIPILTAAGARGTLTDNGIPAGVQQLGMNANINRENILDFRTSQPCEFVTTYPIEITANLELYELPVGQVGDPAAAIPKPGEVGYDPGTFQHLLKSLRALSLQVPGTSLGKHEGATVATAPVGQSGGTIATANQVYAKILGMRQVDEQEGVQVGRYLTYTINFTATDLWLPLAQPA